MEKESWRRNHGEGIMAMSRRLGAEFFGTFWLTFAGWSDWRNCAPVASGRQVPLVTPMGDEMFYRYQQSLIDEAATTLGALRRNRPPDRGWLSYSRNILPCHNRSPLRAVVFRRMVLYAPLPKNGMRPGIASDRRRLAFSPKSPRGLVLSCVSKMSQPKGSFRT
jgi:hypothetical protein